MTDGFGGSGGSSSSPTLLETRDNDGDGLKNCLEDEQGIDPLFQTDTDGDSVGDEYIETIGGIQYNRGSDYVESQSWSGRQDLFCPPAARAANCLPNPRHKDIYVELDYMVDAGIANSANQHLPDTNSLATMVGYFRDAAVTNPDGVNGITMHFDVGPIFDATTTAYNLGGGNAVNHDRDLGTWGPIARNAAGQVMDCGAYSFDEFYAIKNSANAGGGNFDYGRRSRTFYYGIMAHYLGQELRNTVTNQIDAKCWATGIAPISGKDFIVTLGDVGQPNNGNHEHGTQNFRKGTPMHELGHNLGLEHGGNEGMNGKPNYLSVMNYNNQHSGVTFVDPDGGGPQQAPQPYFGYSSVQLPNLFEPNLDERIGLNHVHADDKQVRHHCLNALGQDQFVTTTVDGNGPVNWDCDTNAVTGQPNIEASVNVDLNGDGIRDWLNGPPADWTRLDFTGINRHSGPGQPVTTQFDPLPREWLAQLGMTVCHTGGFLQHCHLPAADQ